MKPFWKNTRKKKSKKHSEPSQQKPRIQTRPKPMEEPWKPPVAVPPKAVQTKETPIVPMLESARPVKKEYVPHRTTMRKSEYYQEFRSKFQQLLSPRSRPIDIWRDFIVMSACAMSNTVDKSHYDEREKRYLETINKYEKSQQHIFPELYADVVMALDENPEQDFLGRMFMDLHLDYEELKQIFTPYHVCQLMADVTMGDLVQQVEEQGYVSINDCCCGAGANLIAAINSARHMLEDAGLNFQNHILVIGQDIEELVALMCYIQISLLGVAGYIKVGNALTEPMTSDDSMENYWFTPMYFSDVWHTRRMIHRFMDLFEKEDK
ncbi:N-6 DNA methylase [Flavonifractor plautii]|jgi:hypothetical protein|uniref:N-6 DNA methylase n=1 Tax=Flavonifractor plautii TaxID=292800 RepID=UPI00189BF3D8|nr:N-6 DNA methylase [Flavonifractor plautii]UBS61667.1 N-6 DNA methylase [Flavonifractor plautii]